MIIRKLFGGIFIIIALLLALAIVGLFPKLLGTIFGFFYMFTGKLTSYQMGIIVGELIFWIFHFIGTIAFWTFGLRWIKGEVK